MVTKMLKLTILDSNSWKRCIDSIAALIDEGTFEFDETGLTLKAMDPSQIAMVDFEMSKDSFKEYEIDEKQGIGIDLSELSKIIRRSRAEDVISLELKSNKLEITFSGKTARKFVMPLIDSTAHPNRPRIEFDANIKIPSTDFKDVLADVELVSNYVVFDATPKALIVSSESESGKAEVDFTPENLLSIEVNQPARAMFPLEYLKNMAKNTDVTTVVSLGLKKDAPLKMEFAIGKGKITYFLAPRIESV